jgi:hypothetical protein
MAVGAVNVLKWLSCQIAYSLIARSDAVSASCGVRTRCRVIPLRFELKRVPIRAQTLEGPLSEANRTYCAHSEPFRF